MGSSDRFEGLSECISRAIHEHFAKTSTNIVSFLGLSKPVLRVEAFLHDGGSSKARTDASPELIVSVCLYVCCGPCDT
jgi:hypothetical protein